MSGLAAIAPPDPAYFGRDRRPCERIVHQVYHFFDPSSSGKSGPDGIAQPSVAGVRSPVADVGRTTQDAHLAAGVIVILDPRMRAAPDHLSAAGA